MLIKIGNRHNLIYPLLLILFIILRRIEVILISKIFNYSWPFLLPVLIFLSKFTAGFIGMYYTLPKEDKIQNNNKKKFIFFGINPIYNKDIIKIPDKYFKIGILIFFASYFDYIGTFIRKFAIYTVYSNKDINDTLEHSVRSFQFFSSALFCYFTIGTTMYKHQKISLIIIFICLIFILIAELLCIKNTFSLKLFSFFLTCFSAMSRAALDTIEKYLFEIDYMNPFRVMMFEGLINTILSSAMFFIFDAPLKDISNLKNKFPDWNIILVLLLLLYTIISGLKNIYRVATIKLFSPMARAVCESIFDPILVIYYSFDKNYIRDYNYMIYFSVILLCSIIMPFFSCIYNEFIILYCCGLEYNTHREITKRAKSFEYCFYFNEDKEGNSDLEIEGEELIIQSISKSNYSYL